MVRPTNKIWIENGRSGVCQLDDRTYQDTVLLLLAIGKNNIQWDYTLASDGQSLGPLAGKGVHA